MENNTIYFGDCLETMEKFTSRSIDLIYIDPPFFSKKDYTINGWGTGVKLKVFEDTWEGGLEDYVRWLKNRLSECWRILKPTGSIYLHCDWHASHYLKQALDQIFSYKNFRNEIIWDYKTGGIGKKWFGRKHDVILFYTKSKNYTFKPIEIKEYYDFKPSLKDRKSGKDEKGWYHYVFLSDVWQIPAVFNMSNEYLGYPTQKPEALLERIIQSSSKEGDVILDPFCGSGTTLAVAHKLGRRWIGIDVSLLACYIAKRRMKNLGIDIEIQGKKFNIEDIKNLPYEDFRKLVCDILIAKPTTEKSKDVVIDAFNLNNNPLQIRQLETIGLSEINEFYNYLKKENKKEGSIVAFSFSDNAIDEIQKLKNNENIEIELIQIKELLDA